MSLKDKTVVVTGGSRGLGLGLVEALVAHGARVTVVARDSDALESVRARLHLGRDHQRSQDRSLARLYGFAGRFYCGDWRRGMIALRETASER
jgi:NAD(P)-dependent dehydrogenase (short-subunit alcohol dehydrogenase family)